MWEWGENPSFFYLQQEHSRARPALPALCLALVLPLLLICLGQKAPIARGHAGKSRECLQGICVYQFAKARNGDKKEAKKKDLPQRPATSERQPIKTAAGLP